MTFPEWHNEGSLSHCEGGLPLSLALPAALVSLLALMVPAPAAALESPPIQVHLADGTSLMLLSWTFSYEYQTWRRGEAPTLGSTTRRDANELWTGKKATPLGSQTLELQYVDRLREVDGLAAKDRVAALTDQEVHALAESIDALPAGGNLGTNDIIVILLVAILVVLLI